MPALRILFIAPYVPSPLRVRPYGFLTQLARRGHRLTLLSAATSAGDEAAAAALEPLCERIEVVPVSRSRALLNCMRGVTNGLPFQALYCNAPALRARLTDLLAARDAFDLVHVEHLRAALLGLDLRGVARVYDAVDCITELFEMTQRHGATWLSRTAATVDLPRTRRFEARLAHRFQRTIVTSEAEAEALSRLTGDEVARQVIHVVPNGVDLAYFTAAARSPDPATLLYVGRMSYHANVAAVLDFMKTTMPAVWKARPETQVIICGADPARAVRRLPEHYGERVSVTGTVADIRPYLQRATVSVSPLPYAAGIQNKVLEAMASATPVVATPAACAALAAKDGDDLLVARAPADFADCVLKLLADGPLRQRIGSGGRRYVETHHNWDNAVERLEFVYQDAISTFRRDGERGVTP
jgi:sugar transferase (PEP-CTERM/EpsH1 system associated)